MADSPERILRNLMRLAGQLKPGDLVLGEIAREDVERACAGAVRMFKYITVSLKPNDRDVPEAVEAVRRAVVEFDKAPEVIPEDEPPARP